MNSVWEDYLNLLFHEPAHWLFELTLMAIFDFIIGFVGYKVLWKRVLAPKLRRDIHEEIDREHHPDAHKSEDGKHGWQGWE